MAPTVTKLRFQTRNPERVNVYLDGAYAFSLPAVEAAHLRLGQALTEAEIQELREQDALQRAYERALRLLSYRPRSEKEIRRYLQRRGEPEARVEGVVERLRASKWVDDEGFARSWVENRQAFRPRSRKALRFELRQKGVDEGTIESVLEDVDDEGKALEVALQRAPRWKDLEYGAFHRRMSNYLSRRGFGYEEITGAVKQAWETVRNQPRDQEEG